MAAFCEHGDKYLGSVEAANFLISWIIIISCSGKTQYGGVM